MIPDSTSEIAAILESWLPSRLGAEEVRVTGLKGGSGAGFSAETFYLDANYRQGDNEHSKSLVLRCQNQGSDFFLDASIEFPYRVMEAMGEKGGIPVPELVGLEMDDTVLGVPFLVMVKMPGKVVNQSPNYNLEGWVVDLAPAQRGQLWRNALDMVARIHRLDWKRGFEFLANPQRGEPGLENYLDWVSEWYQWARGDKPVEMMEIAFERIKNEKPANASVNVLWGDPGSSNILFLDDLSVGTVLDWEMANLGPAEVDLAWWLFFDKLFSEGMGIPRLEGLPTREETIAHYETHLGRPVENMPYYDLLATFRMAIVGMRAVDRQIELGTIPPDTQARSHQPIMCLLAKELGEPVPEVGEDFRVFANIIGM